MPLLPAPPTSAPPLRWGIISTGRIAATFVQDLGHLEGASVTAVGSRSLASATAFADAHGIAGRHGSYDELVHDPAVDAVYVATPHPGHHDVALAAVEAGKAVLVEKPFTMDAAQARSVVAAARRRGTFLMEAMWTRFLPQVVVLRELLAAGELGELRSVTADLGFLADPDPAGRLLAPELGGGALLDVGVYPVSFAAMVLGPPSRVLAASTPTATGVDGQTSVLLEHPGGSTALLTGSILAHSPVTADVVGTAARVHLARRWYEPTGMVLTRADGTRVEYTLPDLGGARGMHAQAAEVARCVAEGRTQSEVMSLDDTVGVMETLDAVRAQIGLTYPVA